MWTSLTAKFDILFRMHGFSINPEACVTPSVKRPTSKTRRRVMLVTKLKENKHASAWCVGRVISQPVINTQQNTFYSHCTGTLDSLTPVWSCRSVCEVWPGSYAFSSLTCFSYDNILTIFVFVVKIICTLFIMVRAENVQSLGTNYYPV